MDLSTKRILITGADGFIGSHLVEELLPKSRELKALALYNSFNTWGWLDTIEAVNNREIQVLSGDIRDPHYCREICKDVDVVFHLAALIAIPYSYVAPDSYVDTNVQGTVNMCQAARDLGIERFVHTSTSEVYGTAQRVPINESHPLQAQSPYSASKIGADAMALSFYSSFELPLTIARPFNTYGPRQSLRAVIPTVITQIAKGQEVIRLGDTRPTRDFNFVKDTVRGFCELAQSDVAVGEVFNIGSQNEITIGDTVKLIAQLMNKTIQIQVDEERLRPSGSEVFRLFCDNSKIQSATGYRPKYSLKEGLIKTIEWFTNHENSKHYKVDLYNV